MTQTTPTLAQAIEVIENLISGAQLDHETEAKDCLASFSEYDWQPLAGTNRERYDQLFDKGISGEMSLQELIEFVGIADCQGEHHAFYALVNAERLIGLHKQFK